MTIADVRAPSCPAQVDGRRRQRRRSLPGAPRRAQRFRALRLVIASAAVVALSCLRLAPAYAHPSEGRSGGPAAGGLEALGRRRAAVLLLPPMAGAAAAGPALAEESFISKITKEARRKAKEDAESGSLFNMNTYKISTGLYNTSDLQSYLPTVFLARRSFSTTLTQLKNPRVNVTDPYLYELLRQQNRIPPIRLLRKDAFRAKEWLREETGIFEAGDEQYERLKKALDEQDTQCLLLSRQEEFLSKAAVKTAVKNTQAVVEAIDDFLEELPAEQVEASKLIAETKKIQVLRLPLVRKAKPEESKKSANTEEISPGAELARLVPDLAPVDLPK